MISLNNLHKGQQAIIKSFTNRDLSHKMIEMGCLPGETITLSKIAPFGCPLAILVAGYELCLRAEEANAIIVELVS